MATNESKLFTVEKTSEGLYKEKGSKFFAYLEPINSKQEAEVKLKRQQLAFTDATHVCYAYRIFDTQFASDAGEPAHTAGAPILRRILAHKLTHVLICVIRYYGGVKLGAPGLIYAYGEAANLAILSNTLIPFVEMQTLTIQFEYPQTSYIKSLLHKYRATVINSQFTNICVNTVRFEKQVEKELRGELEGFIVDN